MTHRGVLRARARVRADGVDQPWWDAADAMSQAHAIEQVRTALARPETYSPRPQSVEVRETHISWVFLAGERAYKLKKPLVLDFLDYGTVERRREMCREEVRLNGRLAPDLYIGVRGVALRADGAVLTDEDDHDAVEFVVAMRRYGEHNTVAALLERGELGCGHAVGSWPDP